MKRKINLKKITNNKTNFKKNKKNKTKKKCHFIKRTMLQQNRIFNIH